MTLNIDYNFNNLRSYEVINKVSKDIQKIKSYYLKDNTRESLYNTYNKLLEYKDNLKELINRIVDIKASLYMTNNKLFSDWESCHKAIDYLIYSNINQLEEMYIKLYG